MSFAYHRDGDLRTCGAHTVVTGQNNVYCEGKLISVNGDPNDHGDGQLIAGGPNVYINGKLVVVVRPDHAQPDDLCPQSPEHCDPETAQGSGTVFAY